MFNTTSITEHYSAYIYGRVRGREEGRKVLKRYREAKKKVALMVFILCNSLQLNPTQSYLIKMKRYNCKVRITSKASFLLLIGDGYF